MMMTIKEAADRIEELQTEYDNFLKLQNYALCVDLTKIGESTYADSPEKDVRRKMLKVVKEEAKIEYDVRCLCSIGAELCKAEMERIKKIIESTKVNI